MLKKRFLIISLILIIALSMIVYGNHYSYTGTSYNTCLDRCVINHAQSLSSVYACGGKCDSIISSNRKKSTQDSAAQIELDRQRKERERIAREKRIEQERINAIYQKRYDEISDYRLKPVKVPCDSIRLRKFVDSVTDMRKNIGKSGGKTYWKYTISADEKRIYRTQVKNNELRCHSFIKTTAQERFQRLDHNWRIREINRLKIPKDSVQKMIPCSWDAKNAAKKFGDGSILEHVKFKDREIKIHRYGKGAQLNCYGFSPLTEPIFKEKIEDKIDCPQYEASQVMQEWEHLGYKKGDKLESKGFVDGKNYKMYITENGPFCFTIALGKKTVHEESLKHLNKKQSEIDTYTYEMLHYHMIAFEKQLYFLRGANADPTIIKGYEDLISTMRKKLRGLKKKLQKNTETDWSKFGKTSDYRVDVSVDLLNAKISIILGVNNKHDIEEIQKNLAYAKGLAETGPLLKKLDLLQAQRIKNRDDAVFKYKEILRKDWNNAEANFALAKVLKEQGKFAESKKYYQKAYENAGNEEYRKRLQKSYTPRSLFGPHVDTWELPDPGVDEEGPSVILRLRRESNAVIRGVANDVVDAARESAILSTFNSYIRVKRLEANDIYNEIEAEFLKLDQIRTFSLDKKREETIKGLGE